MCWNPQVSISTYIFSTLSILLAFYCGVLSLSNLLIIHAFVVMQLIEFFLWIYLHDKTMNTFFSILGFIAVLSQPLLTLFSIENFKYKPIVISSYLFFILYVVLTQNIKFNTVVAKNKHLQWKWLDLPSPIILTWLFFLCFKYFYYLLKYNYKSHIRELYTLLFILITFTLSYFSFLKSKTWGSMWCWFASIISVYFLLKAILVLMK
jgi:hypothetical protein